MSVEPLTGAVAPTAILARRARVAQSAERLTRNEQVRSSILLPGSIRSPAASSRDSPARLNARPERELGADPVTVVEDHGPRSTTEYHASAVGGRSDLLDAVPPRGAAERRSLLAILRVSIGEGWVGATCVPSIPGHLAGRVSVAKFPGRLFHPFQSPQGFFHADDAGRTTHSAY